jgi:predicted MFS family arabinose efflux permease
LRAGGKLADRRSFPSEKRARALGVFMLGLPLGLLLAFSIVGALAQNYGWRVRSISPRSRASSWQR